MELYVIVTQTVGPPQSCVQVRFHNFLPESQRSHKATFVYKGLPN